MIEWVVGFAAVFFIWPGLLAIWFAAREEWVGFVLSGLLSTFAGGILVRLFWNLLAENL